MHARVPVLGLLLRLCVAMVVTVGSNNVDDQMLFIDPDTHHYLHHDSADVVASLLHSAALRRGNATLADHHEHMLLQSVSARMAIKSQLARFQPRNDDILTSLRGCVASTSSSTSSASSSPFDRVYITQDYTGGGGIGNLLLKINAGLSFAVSNGFEYLLPPMLPFGHNESAMCV